MARIMIVDDEPHILTVLRGLLETEDHTITLVQKSKKAIKMIESNEEEFDLLLTDVRMRPVDGLELLRAARKARPDMKVIMLTAYHTPEISKEALRQGAYAYIPKPFTVAKVMDTVQTALAAAS